MSEILCSRARKKNDSRLGKSAIFQSRAFTSTLPLIGLSKPIKPARTSFYTAVQVAKEESHWKNAGKNYTAYDLGIKDQNRSDQILSLPMYVKHNLYASIFELLHEQNKAFHPVLLKYLKTFSTLEYFCCLLYLSHRQQRVFSGFPVRHLRHSPSFFPPKLHLELSAESYLFSTHFCLAFCALNSAFVLIITTVSKTFTNMFLIYIFLTEHL